MASSSETPSSPPGIERPTEQAPGPLEWFKANLIYFVIIGALIVLIYGQTGVNGLFKSGIVAISLGLVIFIHELGHFLAAKWCGVQVRVFSIGFGPPLPGCSFQIGETKYMIGALPLGGYVQMLGEGSENGEVDEGEDSPRSFKRKTVAQRMLIMSAGVIMNVILGVVCLMSVYLHGVKEVVATVWRTDVGFPFWEIDPPSGTRIVEIDGIPKPTFRNVKVETVLSGAARPLKIKLEEPDGKTRELTVQPRKGPGESSRSLGFAPPLSMMNLGGSPKAAAAAFKGKPAFFARTLAVEPGETPLEWKTPTGEWVPLKPGSQGWLDLTRAFEKHPEETLTLKVKGKAGAPREISIAPKGFLPGDNILGTSAAQLENYDPFRVEALPPRQPEGEPDFFEFRRRMRALASQAVVFEAQETKLDEKGKTLLGDKRLVLCGPAPALTLGMTMRMGPVTAIRAGSPGEKAGIWQGDIITQVRILGEDGKAVLDLPQPDPLVLPTLITESSLTRAKKTIEITVLRQDKTAREPSRVTLPAIPLVDPVPTREESSFKPFSPMPITQLGIGYKILNTIQSVVPEGPADKLGLKPGDMIEQVRLVKSINDQGKRTYTWFTPSTKREDGRIEFDQWAYMAQELDAFADTEVGLRVRRGESLLRDAAEEKANGPLLLELKPDPVRHRLERGLMQTQEHQLVKAETLLESLQMGWRETVGSIILIYRSLAGMIRGDLPVESLGGPIEIAAQTFNAADDLIMLIQFIGLISINLAVVNFLPLPPLDGGHMLFLAYEGARGRPAPRTVIDVVTGTGFGLLLLLIAFVFFNDIKRRFFGA